MSTSKTGVPYFVEFICRSLFTTFPQEEFLLWAQNLSQNPFPQCLNAQFLGKSPLPLPRAWQEAIWNYSSFRGVPAAADLYYLPFAGVPARRKSSKTRMVTTIHDVAYLRYPEFVSNDKYLAYLRRAVPLQCEVADHVTTISHATRNDLIELCGVPPEKISVIYPGCNVEGPPANNQPVSPPWAELPENYLLFIGNFEPRKNIGLIYQAMARLAPTLRERQVFLVVAGGGGWKNDQFDEMAKSLGIEDLIFKPGYVPEQALPALYSGALAFLFPSLYEGFGLPVIEAQRCGAPVITSNVSSLPEVVQDSGLQIDPLSVEELASAITRLCESPGLRNELRKKGLANSERFSWEKCARETMGIFRAVTQ